MKQAFFFDTPIDDNYLGHIFAEIYKDRIYGPLVEGKNLMTCVELGANIGIATYYFSQYFQRVISLEPANEHFTNLTMMLEHNQIKNVVPINKAIYIENTKLPFFHNKNRTMYSLHTAVNDNSSEPEQVETITLEKLFEEQKIDHCDFLKLDIEGTEVEIVSSDSFRKVAPKISTILLENHAWSGRNPNQVREALEDNGYTLENVPNDAEIIIARR